MGSGKSIVALCKIPVEGSNDGILACGVVDMPCPLPNAGAAGVGEHHTTNLVKGAEVTILFDGKTHQFRSWGYREFASCFESLGLSLGCNRGRAADVFIR